MYGIVSKSGANECCPRCRQPFNGQSKHFVPFVDGHFQRPLQFLYGVEVCSPCEAALLRWPLERRVQFATVIGLVGILDYSIRKTKGVTVNGRGVRPVSVSESAAVHCCLISWASTGGVPPKTKRFVFKSRSEQLPSPLPRRALRKPSIGRGRV